MKATEGRRAQEFKTFSSPRTMKSTVSFSTMSILAALLLALLLVVAMIGVLR